MLGFSMRQPSVAHLSLLFLLTSALALAVSAVRNPMESVLLSILVSLNAGLALLSFGMELTAVVYLTVIIGGLAVFFLLVVFIVPTPALTYALAVLFWLAMATMFIAGVGLLQRDPRTFPTSVVGGHSMGHQFYWRVADQHLFTALLTTVALFLLFVPNSAINASRPSASAPRWCSSSFRSATRRG
jgi:hypothetical protein